GFKSIARFSHNGDVTFVVQHPPQTMANQTVIVHQKNADLTLQHASPAANTAPRRAPALRPSRRAEIRWFRSPDPFSPAWKQGPAHGILSPYTRSLHLPLPPRAMRCRN